MNTLITNQLSNCLTLQKVTGVDFKDREKPLFKSLIAAKWKLYQAIGLLSVLFTTTGHVLAQTPYPFARPSRTTLLAALNAKNPSHEHPRLYARSSYFDTLRLKVVSDPQMASWYSVVLANADKTVNIDTVPYPYQASPPPTPNTRFVPPRMYALAMAYQITGLQKYADRAYKEMSSICKWPKWTSGPDDKGFLNCADVEQGIGVGYDWCYAALTAAQRKEIRDSTIKKGLNPLIAYYNADPTGYANGSGEAGDVFSNTNRNPWVQGAASTCAMIFGDDEPTISGEIMERTLVILEFWITTYGPDGGCSEGLGYGNGAISTFTRWMACMESALGTSYNYFGVPGIKESAYFAPYLDGPVAALNFHDSGGDDKQYLDVLFFFANRFLQPGLGNLRKNDILAGNTSGGVFDLIWYKPDYYGTTTEILPLDRAFHGKVQSGSFRASFSDPNSMFLAFHAGENNVSHSHLDVGQFNVDAQGLNWALDFGTESLTYNAAYASTYTNRYQLYRLNPGGHNTLLINPSTFFGQSSPALDTITQFVSKPSGAFAIVDMTPAYTTQVYSSKRGYALTSNRSKIIIQDELDLKQVSEVWWNMHTRATATISDDGKTAILTQQGKRMRASLVSPAEGKFVVVDSKPLPATNQNAYQTGNPGTQNLAVKINGVTKTTIMVEIIPVLTESDLTVATLPLIPLNKWSEPRILANIIPTISYPASPVVLTTNSAITPLTPTNTGGAVPATAYATVSTAASVGGQAQGLVTNAAGTILYTPLNNTDDVKKITLPSTVSVFAGLSGTSGSTDGTGTAARFNGPYGIARHPVSGDYYLADADNNKIRKITAAGVVTTYAGTGTAGSTDGAIASATFNSPRGMAFDASGNLYITQASGAIRKIAGTTVSTLATGFSQPWGMAYYNNNLYVTEAVGNKVSKVSLTGTITTLAGSGTAGSTDGTGTAASFNGIRGIAIDSSGNVYVADYTNNKIRKINQAGVVTTVAGSGAFAQTEGVGDVAAFKFTAGLALDGAGNLYVGDPGSLAIRKVVVTGYTISPDLPAGLSFNAATGVISGTPTVTSAATDYLVTAFNKNGSNTTIINLKTATVLPPDISYPASKIYVSGTAIAPLPPANAGGAIYGTVSTIATLGGQAQGLVTSADGSILYAALNNTHDVKKIVFPSTVSVLAGLSGSTGTTDGTGTAARFNGPYGIALESSSGDLYMADANNNKIRKITAAGVVTTYAGTGTAGSTDGAIASATFNSPRGMAFDGSGNLYVSQASGAIRKITAGGTVSTLATGFNQPWGLAYYNSNLYVTEAVGNKVSKVSLTGTVTTLAGSGTAGSTDGTGTAATFNGPRGVIVDPSGDVYVADYSNNKIRKITQAGVVTTIAGSGASAQTDGVGLAAAFKFTAGLALDGSGNLYVGDPGSLSVRKVSVGGVAFTISPALPAGLSFDNTTGIISGTPSAAAVSKDYVITAFNAGGQSQAVVTIRVSTTLPPSITYAGSKDYAINTAITPLSPNNTGGAVPATVYGTVTTPVSSVGGQAQGLAFNSGATILYTPLSNQHAIKTITLPSTVATLAGLAGTSGNTEGTGTAARFNAPWGVAVNPVNGNLYVADATNNKIRQVTPAGVVSTFAGTGVAQTFDLPFASAMFNSPHGLAIDGNGNMYISQTGGSAVIRKITAGNVVSTMAQDLNNPFGIGFSGKYIYAAESSGNIITKISLQGVKTNLAGSGAAGSADGVGAAATFNGPRGIVADSTGTVYVADYSSFKIRRISPQGKVTTVAGSGTNAHTDGVGSAAAFRNPAAITLDGLGNLYVADAGDFGIRKIVITGYTISPALPAGLTFSGTTGVISGTPTVLSAAKDYTITATNKEGMSETILNLAVTATGGMGLKSAQNADSVAMIAVTTKSNTKEQKADTPEISFYPNPVNNLLTVESVILSGQNVTLSMIELNSGITVRKLNTHNQLVQVDMSNLSTGYYILVFTSNKKVVATRKIYKK